MPNKDDDKIISDTKDLLKESSALNKKGEADLERFDKTMGEIEDENKEAQSELDEEISEIIKSMEVATNEFESDLGGNE